MAACTQTKRARMVPKVRRAEFPKRVARAVRPGQVASGRSKEHAAKTAPNLGIGIPVRPSPRRNAARQYGSTVGVLGLAGEGVEIRLRRSGTGGSGSQYK
jgi:hypothetical protein